MKKKIVVGVDIGGTRMRMGCVDAAYRLENTQMAFCDTLFGTESTAQVICGILGSYLGELGGDVEVLGVSIGAPSTLSRDRQTILSTPNIPGLNDIRLGEIIKRELGLSSVLELSLIHIYRGECGRICGEDRL